MGAAEGVLDWLMLVKARAPGLSLGQLAALLHTARREGVRMTELADLCRESVANTSRYVRSMTAVDYPGSLGEAHGLLELQRGAQDARVRHVLLSADGRALIKALEAVMDPASLETTGSAQDEGARRP
ncbi:MarR family winged helix-turn-helix transcriptional regulator [Brevundimonas sp.]|uniref:MarR family winged helix-turn-helix transcriptional regulator n=1 Tax=Brevundimonas sp. TaxID=1871086 RepID=UPI002FDB1D8B